jgi:hypothetical protein
MKQEYLNSISESGKKKTVYLTIRQFHVGMYDASKEIKFHSIIALLLTK